MGCERCCDTFWVCETHPDRPWNDGSNLPGTCECGAPGMPCPDCNIPPPGLMPLDTDGVRLTPNLLTDQMPRMGDLG